MWWQGKHLLTDKEFLEALGLPQVKLCKKIVDDIRKDIIAIRGYIMREESIIFPCALYIAILKQRGLLSEGISDYRYEMKMADMFWYRL